MNENSAIAQYHCIEITVKMVSKCAKMSIRYDAIRDATLGTRQRASWYRSILKPKLMVMSDTVKRFLRWYPHRG